MEGTKIIEQGIGELKNDALRFGLQGVKSDVVGSHPLESSYHSASTRQEEMKRKILANTYGSAFPLKMELDRKILSRKSHIDEIATIFVGSKSIFDLNFYQSK